MFARELEERPTRVDARVEGSSQVAGKVVPLVVSFDPPRANARRGGRRPRICEEP